MGKEIVFIGYHGTGKHLVEKIRRDGFIETSCGFLGRGVYFFEGNERIAYKWVLKDKPDYKESCTLKAEINVTKSKVLDITNPNSEERQAINENLPKILNRMKQRQFRLPKESSFFEGKVIDELCKKEDYKVIRAATITNVDENEGRLIHLGIANTIELCVKDKSLIGLQ